MTNNLKPCPFCGNKNVKYHTGIGIQEAYDVGDFVYCNQCAARFVFGNFDLDKTVEQWNKRHEPNPRSLKNVSLSQWIKERNKLEEKLRRQDEYIKDPRCL